jgi:hypothetical protein
MQGVRVDPLRRLVRVEPGVTQYDVARAIWNGMHDRRPAVIVQAGGVADVMAGLRFVMLLFGRRPSPKIRNRNGVTDGEHLHDIEQKLRCWGHLSALPRCRT